MQHFSFDEISAFYRNQRGLNLNMYEPQVARKTIVHPAQNRHYSSNARGSHPRGFPNGVGFTRRQASVPWGVKSITNSSRYNAQRDKNLHPPSASSFGRPPRCGHFVNSTTRAQKFSAPSATGHYLPMTLGTTLLSLVRSRVVPQLKRCGCPILCTLVRKF